MLDNFSKFGQIFNLQPVQRIRIIKQYVILLPTSFLQTMNMPWISKTNKTLINWRVTYYLNKSSHTVIKCINLLKVWYQIVNIFDGYFLFCLEYLRFSQKSSTTAPIVQMSRTCTKIPTSRTFWAVSWLTRGPLAVTVCTVEKPRSLDGVSMYHWLDTCTLRTGDTSKMPSKGPGQTQVSIEVLPIISKNIFFDDLPIMATVYVLPTEAQWTCISMYITNTSKYM